MGVKTGFPPEFILSNSKGGKKKEDGKLGRCEDEKMG